jgi:hypothetical protein
VDFKIVSGVGREPFQKPRLKTFKAVSHASKTLEPLVLTLASLPFPITCRNTAVFVSAEDPGSPDTLTTSLSFLAS